MRMTVICKASTHIGLGHLIRSKTFVTQILAVKKDIELDYILIGDKELLKILTNQSVNIYAYENEEQIEKINSSDYLVLDMIEMNESVLLNLKKFTQKTVILSPIFNHLDKVDYYFGRTKYTGFDKQDYPDLKVYAGLEYAIIQDNCRVISAGIFEDNLKNKNYSIAVSMGGGDANNKTLEVIKALKACKSQVTFWVMLGEGYKHSYDDLVNEIKKNTSHEIILAKTNSSMWNILKNCILCILPGGITTYEAVYAGLPTINFFDDYSQKFLIQELLDNKAAYNFGLYTVETLNKIVAFIDEVVNSPKELLQMHVNTKMLIDGQGSSRILNILLESAG